jgi:hypothetical protein
LSCCENSCCQFIGFIYDLQDFYFSSLVQKIILARRQKVLYFGGKLKRLAIR